MPAKSRQVGENSEIDSSESLVSLSHTYQHTSSGTNGGVCMAKSPKKPDDDHLKLKLWVLEASAIGRYPITLVFILAVLYMCGKLVGSW